MVWKSELTGGVNAFWNGVDLSSNSREITGWGLLDWGASHDRVARIYPKAVESGGSLVLTGEQSARRQWSLTFGFDSSRRLSSVALSFAGSRETADYAPLAEKIIARLGTPTWQSGNTSTWTRGDNSFSLSKSPGGGLVLSSTA